MSIELSGQDFADGRPVSYAEMRKIQYVVRERINVRYRAEGFSERILERVPHWRHVFFVSADGKWIATRPEAGDY